MIKSFSGQLVFRFAILRANLLTLAKTDYPSILYYNWVNYVSHDPNFVYCTCKQDKGYPNSANIPQGFSTIKKGQCPEKMRFFSRIS